ncbi:hypothetical protein JOC78_003498 [Bacillus ectoiniformans]|nr:hypothetical protein [Bacillus ectoiniformans]MBM7650506.1 hypothetical protein [Bacillus ectoiniformans]
MFLKNFHEKVLTMLNIKGILDNVADETETKQTVTAKNIIKKLLTFKR